MPLRSWLVDMRLTATLTMAFLAAVLPVLAACRRAACGETGLTAAGRCAINAMTVGGLIAAPFWWLDVESGFAWDLPPLASRMAAAMALAFAVCGWLVLSRPTIRRQRIYLAAMAACLLPPALTAALFHLDRFEGGRPGLWAYFLASGMLSVLAIAELASGFLTRPGMPSRRIDNPFVPLWLVMVGLAMVAWALALFLAPDTLFYSVFLWPDDALTSRLLGAGLLTVGVVNLLSTADEPSARMALLFTGTFGTGALAAISLTSTVGFDPPLLYLVGIGGSGLVSLALLAMISAAPATAGSPAQRRG